MDEVAKMSDGSFVPDVPRPDEELIRMGFDVDRTEMLEFYEAARPWLAERGINLYETNNKVINGIRGERWVGPSTTCDPAVLPYASCSRPETITSKFVAHVSPLGYAQDSQYHDLIVKLVDKDTDHHRILQRLLEDKAFCNPATFPCVLPPVNILDTPHDYVFVLMPRWGYFWIKDLSTVREVLRFIRCLLQGLAFLHERRIVHRDIIDINMLVNRYSIYHDHEAHREDLNAHRKSGSVFYALMDFDQSLILPMDTCIKGCRRPSFETGWGNDVYKPWDVSLGQPTYNPFALDVGMLGNVFRSHLAEVVFKVPACAALFDKMTATDPSQRFTAEEAFRFFRETTDDLDEETLDTALKMEIDNYGRYWDKLSPEVCAEWARYRTPSRPWFQVMVGWIMRFYIPRTIIISVRHFLNV